MKDANLAVICPNCENITNTAIRGDYILIGEDEKTVFVHCKKCKKVLKVDLSLVIAVEVWK